MLSRLLWVKIGTMMARPLAGMMPRMIRVIVLWIAFLAVAVLAILTSVLLAKDEPRFTFAVIGDRTGSAVEGIYEGILGEVSELNPDLIITVGDHIEGYLADSARVEEQWDELVGLMEKTGIQYHLTPGNHDIWDRQSEAIYRKRFGAPDKYFRYMGKVFVLLDVSMFNQADALPKEKIDWLKRVLEVSKNSTGIFVFYHKPFWCEDFSAERADLLHDVFRNYPVKAVFTGHYHRYFHAVRDSIEYFGLSSSGASLPPGGKDRGSFYSYLLAKATGDSLSVRLLEPGIFTPVDIMTFEDAVRMAEVEEKSVKLSELLAYDVRLSSTGQVTITIENPEQVTLRDTAQWVLRGDWAVEPMRDYVEVPPEEVGKLTAFVRCDGSLFPVPLLQTHVPCCDGKVVEVAKPLNVKRVIYADYADSAPRIDGMLDEPVWQEIKGESNYFGPQGGRALGDSTVLKICYDTLNLYLGVECFDSDMGTLSATVTERDGFAGNDEAVTFLFEPLRGSNAFYQVGLNPLGTLFDRKIEICPFGTYVADPRWNVPAEVKVRLLTDRWLVEMAIPLAALAGGAAGESRWGFNFTRIQQRLGTTSDFQAPYRYRSDSIGLLGFR